MNAPLFINPNRLPLDETYMQMAEIWAKRSKANRLQVGALIVKDQQIISDGYNGMPSGVEDDVCEYWDGSNGLDVALRTKPEVLHAESNALLKISKNGGTGAEGATLYTTYSPCPECAKLIKQAKIARVVYRHQYRLLDGIVLLRKLGVSVDRLEGGVVQQSHLDELNTAAKQHVYVPTPAPAPAPVPVAPPRQPIIPRSDPIPAVAPAPATVQVVPPLSTPVISEDEVARLLAEWEASQAQQAAAVAKVGSQPQPPLGSDDGRYRSSFV